jgi:glycosyltransferase involved in cell wall biosynthesis
MSFQSLSIARDSIVAATGRPGLLRIAHVVLSLDCGGLERIVVALAREGVKRGHQITVICLERPGMLAARVEDLGATVRCVHKRPGLRLGVVGRLRKILREIRPDVVHTHQIGALFYAGPAARQNGVGAVVHTEHGKHYASRLRTRWLGRLAGRYAARFFCVSKDIAEEAASHRIVPRSKIEVVANGIDTVSLCTEGDGRGLRRSLGAPEGAPIVGTVGRLNEVKRQDLLIRSIARIPEAHLLLVGDGPLMGRLKELAADLKVDGRVHFVGYQTHPEAYLHVMDVFALTSRSEGMPLSVLEAWAAGLAVVASRVGGLPDLIEDGRTGLLFSLGDEQGLTTALRVLLADRERAGRMGEAGRACVRARYSLERMATDYETHYRDLLGAAHEGRTATARGGA